MINLLRIIPPSLLVCFALTFFPPAAPKGVVLSRDSTHSSFFTSSTDSIVRDQYRRQLSFFRASSQASVQSVQDADDEADNNADTGENSSDETSDYVEYDSSEYYESSFNSSATIEESTPDDSSDQSEFDDGEDEIGQPPKSPVQPKPKPKPKPAPSKAKGQHFERIIYSTTDEFLATNPPKQSPLSATTAQPVATSHYFGRSMTSFGNLVAVSATTMSSVSEQVTGSIHVFNLYNTNVKAEDIVQSIHQSNGTSNIAELMNGWEEICVLTPASFFNVVTKTLLPYATFVPTSHNADAGTHSDHSNSTYRLAEDFEEEEESVISYGSTILFSQHFIVVAAAEASLMGLTSAGRVLVYPVDVSLSTAAVAKQGIGGNGTNDESLWMLDKVYRAQSLTAHTISIVSTTDQQQPQQHTNAAARARFGTAVAITAYPTLEDQEYRYLLAVGAPGDSSYQNIEDHGAVYLFTCTSVDRSWILQTILTGTEATAGYPLLTSYGTGLNAQSYFGHCASFFSASASSASDGSLTETSTYLVVTAPGVSSQSIKERQRSHGATGAVFVYAFTLPDAAVSTVIQSSWTLQEIITAPASLTSDPTVLVSHTLSSKIATTESEVICFGTSLSIVLSPSPASNAAIFMAVSSSNSANTSSFSTPSSTTEITGHVQAHLYQWQPSSTLTAKTAATSSINADYWGLRGFREDVMLKEDETVLNVDKAHGFQFLQTLAAYPMLDDTESSSEVPQYHYYPRKYGSNKRHLQSDTTSTSGSNNPTDTVYFDEDFNHVVASSGAHLYPVVHRLDTTLALEVYSFLCNRTQVGQESQTSQDFYVEEVSVLLLLVSGSAVVKQRQASSDQTEVMNAVAIREEEVVHVFSKVLSRSSLTSSEIVVSYEHEVQSFALDRSLEPLDVSSVSTSSSQWSHFSAWPWKDAKESSTSVMTRTNLLATEKDTAFEMVYLGYVSANISSSFSSDSNNISTPATSASLGYGQSLNILTGVSPVSTSSSTEGSSASMHLLVGAPTAFSPLDTETSASASSSTSGVVYWEANLLSLFAERAEVVDRYLAEDNSSGSDPNTSDDEWYERLWVWFQTPSGLIVCLGFLPAGILTVITLCYVQTLGNIIGGRRNGGSPSSGAVGYAAAEGDEDDDEREDEGGDDGNDEDGRLQRKERLYSLISKSGSMKDSGVKAASAVVVSHGVPHQLLPPQDLSASASYEEIPQQALRMGTRDIDRHPPRRQRRSQRKSKIHILTRSTKATATTSEEDGHGVRSNYETGPAGYTTLSSDPATLEEGIQSEAKMDANDFIRPKEVHPINNPKNWWWLSFLYPTKASPASSAVPVTESASASGELPGPTLTSPVRNFGSNPLHQRRPTPPHSLSRSSSRSSPPLVQSTTLQRAHRSASSRDTTPSTMTPPVTPVTQPEEELTDPPHPRGDEDVDCGDCGDPGSQGPLSAQYYETQARLTDKRTELSSALSLLSSAISFKHHNSNNNSCRKDKSRETAELSSTASSLLSTILPQTVGASTGYTRQPVGSPTTGMGMEDLYPAPYETSSTRCHQSRSQSQHSEPVSWSRPNPMSQSGGSSYHFHSPSRLLAHEYRPLAFERHVEDDGQPTGANAADDRSDFVGGGKSQILLFPVQG